MRKVALVLIAAAALFLMAAYYPSYVEKPELDGSGPLGVRLRAGLPVPEYHSPLEWWRTHHMEALNRGDFAQADCLYCHEPETSCNNCHGYVGVVAIQP